MHQRWSNTRRRKHKKSIWDRHICGLYTCDNMCFERLPRRHRRELDRAESKEKEHA